MEKFTTELYERMNTQLREITTTAENSLLRAERCCEVIQGVLQQLKEFILNYEFTDKAEEIRFFKEIKPRFLKELIFQIELYHMEEGKPVGDKGTELAYYGQLLERVRIFFERNKQLYTYYRKESSVNDEHYFLRQLSGVAPIAPIGLLDLDPRFSTVESFQFAKMQAYEQFSKYIRQCIYHLDHPEIKQTDDENAEFQATWTDTKVDLIEMGYGIFAKGSVNHGKASLKLIMSMLSKMFDIDLGNYYAVIQQNIRLRKRKERTHYLNSVIEFSERRMDYLDENPVRG